MYKRQIHLFASSDSKLLGLPTAQSLEAVLQKLKELRSQLDLILLTGDLSQDGTEESYRHLQELLAPLQLPTYWLTGNHDCFPTMERSLKFPFIHPQKAFQLGGWNFLLLNSAVPGKVHGYLSSEILNWLEFQLQHGENKPTLVGLHHPPFLVNSNWLDTSTLQNSEDLFAVLDRHPQVKLVIFGHIHQNFQQQRQDVEYLGTPSTCVQFEPQSSNFSLDNMQPGFRLLDLYPDGTWKTQVERVVYGHQLDLAATGY